MRAGGEDAILALAYPVTSKPKTVNKMIEKTCCPGVGASAPKKGIMPPAVKLIALAKPACTGRALVCSY